MIFKDSDNNQELAVLLMPVLLACGVGLYFSLSFEPLLSVVLSCFLAASAALFSVRDTFDRRHRFYRAGMLGLAVFAVLLGFTAASARTAMIATPMLSAPLKFANITGTVHALEMKANGGQRITFSRLEVEELETAATPRYVRLTMRKADERIRVGDRVTALANIAPPSPPVQPGAFDFQRHSFFKQIGGSGFIYKINAHDPARDLFMLQRLNSIRSAISRVVIEGADNPERGGIMAALMTGMRTGVSDADAAAMRGSGLAHMLAISGLHVGLFAGAIFFAARMMMALIPGMALRRPIKKYAAALAIIGAFGYMLIAGVSVPTQRAMIMTFIFFLAIMLDRSPISMRLVAITASIILLLQPESLISASFQMSFAAVVALVYGYDKTRGFWQAWGRRKGLLQKLMLYVVSVIFTSLIASLATAPFALYHFQQTALYSILANMVAVPVLGFVVMPAMMLTLFLIPFSGHAAPAWIMEQGVGLILAIAHYVTELEMSVFLSAAWPLSALVLCVVAGLSLILCRGYFKAVSLMFLALSFFILNIQKQPNILISSSKKLIAFRAHDGALIVSSKRGERFVRENWLRLSGQGQDVFDDWINYEEEQSTDDSVEGGNTLPPILNCDAKSCLLTVHNGLRDKPYKVAFPRVKSALPEDCAVADLVVAPFSVSRRTCAAARHIDHYNVKYGGAHAVFIGQNSVEIKTDKQIRGARPWVLLPQSQYE